MESTFLESRAGHPWNCDRGGDDFNQYQESTPGQLEIAVADHDERPTKESLQRPYSNRRWLVRDPEAAKAKQLVILLVLTLTADAGYAHGVVRWH